MNKMFRSDGSQWHFSSGIVLALSGNIIIAALAPEKRPHNFRHLVIAGLLFLIAAGCFTATGWALQRLDQIARTKSFGSMGRYDEIKMRLVAASRGRLTTYVVIGFVAAIVALLIIGPLASCK